MFQGSFVSKTFSRRYVEDWGLRNVAVLVVWFIEFESLRFVSKGSLALFSGRKLPSNHICLAEISLFFV
jgi:hypothetical protein